MIEEQFYQFFAGALHTLIAKNLNELAQSPSSPPCHRQRI